MFQICFYVPATHAEEVKNALFRAGAGKIGNYSHCAWQVLGEGQFLPLSGSKAFIGSEDSLEKVPEYKVEVICEKNVIAAVIQTLKKIHPYETPAYQVIKLENDFVEF